MENFKVKENILILRNKELWKEHSKREDLLAVK
jgi:hypothetical protein